MTSQHVLSSYVVTGMLLGVGFVIPQLWFFGLVGVAAHLYLLTHVEQHAIFGSFLAWWIKFLFVLSFYWSVYPIRWLPFDFAPAVELFFVILYWLTVSLFLATGVFVLVYGYRLVRGAVKHTHWLHFLALPLLWMLGEVTGSFLLSVFTLGAGSVVNGYFSLGYLGLLLGNHALLVQVANIGGVYALSVTVVIISLCLLESVRRLKSMSRVFIPGGVLLLLILTAAVALPVEKTQQTKQLSVATINTNFPVAEAFRRESQPRLQTVHTEALEAALALKPDYIITGEDERLLDQASGIDRAKNFFQFRYASETQPVIVDSSRITLGGDAVLQGVVYDTAANTHYITHKKYLVPQGEFIPYLYEKLFQLAGFGTVMTELHTMLSYRIGPKTSQADFSPKSPSILFCFESSSGMGVRELVLERPNTPFIAHPVSHVWFNDSEILRQQLAKSLQVQAIWNDVAIVSAGRHAPSELFLPSGAMLVPAIAAEGEYWQVRVAAVPIR